MLACFALLDFNECFIRLEFVTLRINQQSLVERAIAVNRGWTIHYRCDDGKKKLLSWGDILVSLRS